MAITIKRNYHGKFGLETKRKEVHVKMTRLNLKTTFLPLVLLINLFSRARANEIIGCGGFVKSHQKDIDFSKVEVEL